MRTVAMISLGLMALASTGCARSVYGKHCTNAGLSPGTQQHEDCVTANHIAGKQQAQQDLGEALGLGILVGAGYLTALGNQGGAVASQPNGPRTILCPDGTQVFGWECVLAPNGVFVGGPAQLAPNGEYVGGYGRVLLCPDGTYVVGSRCYMLQDGRYVGY